MEELLIYTICIIGLFALGYFGIKLKRKFEISKVELEFVELILGLVDYVTRNFEFKHKEGVATIVKYTLEALLFIEEYDEIYDIEIKKEMVKDKAIEICLDNGIDILEGAVIEVIDKILDYILIEKNENKR